VTGVTRGPKLPAHGTVQRYRLELADKKSGKGKGPCDRCRSANSERAKNARANAVAKTRRAQMAIVEPVTDSGHTDPAPEAPRPAAIKRRRIGVMERAVDQDIKEIDTGLRVPFHRSLSALARQLAREIDEPSTPANARSQSSRQLFEVLRSLRTQKEGDDDSAAALVLQAAGFGTPLVPGRAP
jgi:hypothetical protein